jgi:aminoglycoside phosphotransferase (APT) family kinase protein
MAEQDAPAQVEFDRDRLNMFLRGAIPDLNGVMRIQRISGGQSNPTFFVSYDDRKLVLRKKPSGELLPSAHAIDREFRIMNALRETDIPVPNVLLYCHDREIIGTSFYIMERLEGNVFHDCNLPGVPAEWRSEMYHSLARTLAKLHNADPVALGLGDYGKSGNYFARQIGRWTKQWQLAQMREDRNMRRLIEWLPRHVPTDDTTAIAHGDYRLGNVMYDSGKPNLIGVLDWELSTLGHPLADLAHNCIAWHSLPSEYGGLMGLELAGLSIPSQAEYEQDYYETVYHSQRMTSFHMAFALFRFAAVFEGIAARVKSGNAAGKDAAHTAGLSASFAQRAVDVLDGA